MVLCLSLLVFCDAAGGVLDAFDRTTMYEALYAKHGYHKDLNFSHSVPVIRKFIEPAYPAAARHGKHVLDVGCSHGFAVAYLWKQGFCARGVDLSPTAVQMALGARKLPEQLASACTAAPLFQPASAASLPFRDGEFHAIVSTDVLEHVPEPLVPAVVSEMTRVASEHLFLNIAAVPEFNKRPHGALTESERQAPLLHETVHDHIWWQAQFDNTSKWICSVPHKQVRRSRGHPRETAFTLVCNRRPA
jgi:SAM-dependent methyltransferase